MKPSLEKNELNVDRVIKCVWSPNGCMIKLMILKENDNIVFGLLLVFDFSPCLILEKLGSYKSICVANKTGLGEIMV